MLWAVLAEHPTRCALSRPAASQSAQVAVKTPPPLTRHRCNRDVVSRILLLAVGGQRACNNCDNCTRHQQSEQRKQALGRTKERPAARCTFRRALLSLRPGGPCLERLCAATDSAGATAQRVAA